MQPALVWLANASGRRRGYCASFGGVWLTSSVGASQNWAIGAPTKRPESRLWRCRTSPTDRDLLLVVEPDAGSRYPIDIAERSTGTGTGASSRHGQIGGAAVG
jgi:hypothetical protein